MKKVFKKILYYHDKTPFIKNHYYLCHVYSQGCKRDLGHNMVTIFMENLPQDVRISPNLLTQTTIEGALEFIHHIIDFIVHIDHHNNLVVQYGGWTYAILFLIVFCETGLVVTPFFAGRLFAFRHQAAYRWRRRPT